MYGICTLEVIRMVKNEKIVAELISAKIILIFDIDGKKEIIEKDLIDKEGDEK